MSLRLGSALTITPNRARSPRPIHELAPVERAIHEPVLLQALASEEGHPLAGEYRRRHGLPPASSVQRALQSLERTELVNRSAGLAWIREPLCAQWLQSKT